MEFGILVDEANIKDVARVVSDFVVSEISHRYCTGIRELRRDTVVVWCYQSRS
jgi:hypothetical protein